MMTMKLPLAASKRPVPLRVLFDETVTVVVSISALATRAPLGKLFAGGLLLLAITLGVFPFVAEEWQAYAYAAALAAAGGAITVCFFTVWRREYGPAALGRIQGAAQLLTVLFSAIGPLLFAAFKTRLGAYAPLFPWLAGTALALAACAWFVPVKRGEP